MFVAERAGFEPAKPFWSLHTFQACAFDHSAISPFQNIAKFRNNFLHKILFRNFSSHIFLKVFYNTLIIRVLT